MNLYPAGIDMVIRFLNTIANWLEVDHFPQTSENAAYYTFPTREEFSQFYAKGYSLCDADEYIDWLKKSFLTDALAQQLPKLNS